MSLRIPRKLAIVGDPGVGKTSLLMGDPTRGIPGLPTPGLVLDCDDGSAGCKVEGDGWHVVVPQTPNDVIKYLLAMAANPKNLRSLIIDGSDSFFEIAKRVQRGAPAENKTYDGAFKLNWDQMMGSWDDALRLGCEISKKHGIFFAATFHLNEDYVILGKNEDGTVRKKLIGWTLNIPGQAPDRVYGLFDEVHLLQCDSAGKRQLITANGRTLLDGGVRFKTKSRFGVKGPIADPTWAKIVEATPQPVLPQAAPEEAK